MTFTHAELIQIGAKWLYKKGHKVILKELVACTLETPDLLAFKFGKSLLLEVKRSRSDFLADKKKIFRRDVALGMGNFRSFICPAGLISPEELPEKWGLLYVSEKGKVSEVVKPVYQQSNLTEERMMLISVIRRLIDGFPYEKYLHGTKEAV